MAVRDDFTAGEVLTASDLNDTFLSKLNLAGGKILQIVRATDATDRTTTSATYVDASLSVTITPQKSTSAILLLYTGFFTGDSGAYCGLQISDNSNNSISGAQDVGYGGSSGHQSGLTAFGYSTPATTSATTYKTRFKRAAGGGTVTLVNSATTGQMYALEISA